MTSIKPSYWEFMYGDFSAYGDSLSRPYEALLHSRIGLYRTLNSIHLTP